MKKEWSMKNLGCMLLAASVTAVMMTGCGSVPAEAAEASGEKVVIATGNSFAPYCYLNEDNELVGYDIDVLKALDEHLEAYSFDIQGMSFNTAVVSIDSGAADMVAFQLVPSDDRKEKYIFPETSYMYSPLALCVRTDSGILNLADMKDKTIYGTPTTYEYVLLKAYNDAHPDTAYEIVAVSDMEVADMYRGVSNKTVDANLTYQATFEKVVPAIGLENVMLTEPVIIEEAFYMIAKDKPEFRDAVDKALRELKEDGTLSGICEKYFGEDYFTKYADMVQNSSLQ